MTNYASGLLLDWEQVTGQSRFTIELVTIPIFSAFAGLITNWTGVWMLFAPVQFVGFRVPGLKTVYPYLPRRIQVLPIFAPGGRFGFRGFIPARTEKMASLTVDKAIAKIGGPSEFFEQLEPAAIAGQFAAILRDDFEETVDGLMTRGYPSWPDLPPQAKALVYDRVADELPTIAQNAFDQIGAHIDELLNVKTMVIDFLRRNPALLKDIIYGFGAPELRFMVRSGLLGFPFGIVLALYLHVHPSLPLVHVIPNAVVVLLGAAMIGVVVNIIAVRVVFTPADPKPRYLCLWRQALFATRQQEAAADFGHAIAYRIITMPTIVDHLLEGPNGDKTRQILHQVMEREIDRILGRMKPIARIAVGERRLAAITAESAATAIAVVPSLSEDVEFNRNQSDKLDILCTQKLRELPSEEFVDLLYSAVEQDAWLLYLHGGVLGVAVGVVHLIVFGA